MHIRNLLLSGVVFGSVAMMSSASWAQTAPKVVYKPQGEWAVTRMAAKGPGKDPYCTMARRFGENTILTFARNAKDETSLAMDFPPNTLAKGQSYYVTLDAGSNEKRAFDVTPVSDKAMVIRLGQDMKFHDALNSTGVLNVDVAGLQFEFDVPDMAKGHQDLGGCVTSIIEPAAGMSAKLSQAEPMKMAEAAPVEAAPLKEIVPVADDGQIVRRASDDILAAPITNSMPDNMPSTMPETSPMPRMNEAQTSEAEALREENMRLKNALERERRAYEDRAMTESSGSSQVSEVMEKLKLLEKENSDLKYQVADARSGAPQTASVSPASCAPGDASQAGEISMLREENARLKSDMAVQKTAMTQLEMKAGQAGEGNAAADNAAVSRMQSRIDELLAQNSQLQTDVMSAQASASAAAVKSDGSISISQLRSVEAQLQAVEQERDNLRAQIEKVGAGKEEDLIKLSGSDWTLEQATRRYNEAEREIRRLGGQLEQAHTQCSTEKKEIEYMLFDPEIATQEQISRLMTLETEVNAAKAELGKKDAEVSDKMGAYEEQLAKLQAELDAAKSSSTEVAALKNELTVSKQTAAEKEKLAMRVAELEAERSRSEISESERLSLQERVSMLENEKVALEQKLMAAIQPAGGAARVGIERMPPQAAEPVMAQTVDVEPVVAVPTQAPVELAAYASSSKLSAGAVSSRDDSIYSAPVVALAPKSAVASDSFVTTKDVVEPVIQAAALEASMSDHVTSQVAQPVAVPSSNLVTAEALSSQLRQAGLALSGDVKKADNVSGPGFVAYSWNASGLFGSAEQKPMANAEQFMTMVNQYLDKTKSRCTGDFAASPVPTQSVAGVQVASYEIACIGADSAGATAALVFYGKDGLFTTVAHEASMDTMDVAMDARDRIVASLSSGKVTN